MNRRIITFFLSAFFISIPLVASDNPTIGDIIVHGNSRITDTRIKEALPYKTGAPFDAEKSASAISSVYALNAFTHITLEKETRADETIALHVTVTERPVSKDITFDGNDNLSDTHLEDIIGKKSLFTLDDEIARQLAITIKKEYRKNGFHHVEVVPQVTYHEDGSTAYASVAFGITEHSKSRIRSISFVGNKNVPGRDLRAYLRNRESWLLGALSDAGTFNPEELDIDKAIVGMLYRDRGYYAAHVADTAINFSENNSIIDIVFTVDEGPLYSVSDISVDKDPDIPHHLLNRVLSLAPGDIYNEGEIRNMIKGFESVCGEYGYIDAQITPQVIPDVDAHTISITFHIDKGKKFRLNRINITGNETTRDHVIRRQIMMEEGAMITKSALDLSKKRVEYLSYFDKEEGVVWKKHRIDDELVDLELKVKEAPSREVNFGIDMGPSKENSASGLKYFGRFDLRNMFGQGWDFLTNLKLTGKHITEFMLGLSDPYFLNTNLQAACNISFNKMIYDQWKFVDPKPIQKIWSATTRLGIPLPRLGHGTSLALELGFQHIANNSNPSLDGTSSYTVDTSQMPAKNAELFKLTLDQRMKSGVYEWLGFDLTSDTRNHQIYPNDGYKLSLKTKWAPPGLNKTFQFIKSTVSGSWYTPLIGIETLVLALHGEIGFVQNTHASGSIPYRELYNMGGQNTIRGFTWGQAGPSWEYTSPMGGKKMVQMNAELIFPINQHIRAHVFYDAGCAWDTPKEELIRNIDSIRNDSFNLRHSIGIGLNITRPQPIKLSFGYKLDRNKKQHESPHEFHIGMNTAF